MSLTNNFFASHFTLAHTDLEASGEEAKVLIRRSGCREAGDAPKRQEEERDGQGHINDRLAFPRLAPYHCAKI